MIFDHTDLRIALSRAQSNTETEFEMSLLLATQKSRKDCENVIFDAHNSRKPILGCQKNGEKRLKHVGQRFAGSGPC